MPLVIVNVPRILGRLTGRRLRPTGGPFLNPKGGEFVLRFSMINVRCKGTFPQQQSGEDLLGILHLLRFPDNRHHQHAIHSTLFTGIIKNIAGIYSRPGRWMFNNSILSIRLLLRQWLDCFAHLL